MAYDGQTERQQEREQKRAAQLAKRRADARDAAIRQCFATPEGRALLWWLLEIGRVNTQPFSGTAEKTAFACGELNVGNRILAQIIEVNPEGYLTMLKENKVEHERITSPSGDDDPDGDYTGAWDGDHTPDPDPEPEPS